MAKQKLNLNWNPCPTEQTYLKCLQNVSFLGGQNQKQKREVMQETLALFKNYLNQ